MDLFVSLFLLQNAPDCSPRKHATKEGSSPGIFSAGQGLITTEDFIADLEREADTDLRYGRVPDVEMCRTSAA